MGRPNVENLKMEGKWLGSEPWLLGAKGTPMPELVLEKLNRRKKMRV